MQKKDSDFIKDQSSGQMIYNINSYLNSKKSIKTPIKNDVIKRLSSNLNFPEMNVEELNSKEKLITVPISPGFKSNNNKSKTPIRVLLLIENNSGEIRKENIVQFLPKNKNYLQCIPKNTFHKLYNENQNIPDGIFPLWPLLTFLIIP